MDSVVVSLSKLLPGEAAGDVPWCSCPWPAGTMLVSASLALEGGQVSWISVASSPLHWRTEQSCFLAESIRCQFFVALAAEEDGVLS
jgi:hypothetical protein